VPQLIYSSRKSESVILDMTALSAIGFHQRIFRTTGLLRRIQGIIIVEQYSSSIPSSKRRICSRIVLFEMVGYDSV